MKTIGEITKVGAGQSAPQDVSAFSNEGTPFVRAGSLEFLCKGASLNRLERINEQQAKIYKLKLYPSGTILFAKSGMSAVQNRVFVLPKPAHVVSHLATIEVKSGVDSKFLSYFWQNFKTSNLIQDPAYPSISLEAVGNVEIELPKPDEQKRIAAILDKADRLRRQRRFTQTLSDSFLQSVFIKMFGDPLSNSMNWNFTELGLQLKNIDSGNSPVCEEFRRKHIEWAVLRLSAVTSGRFLPNENKILPSNVKPNPNYEVKTGDVLFTRKNTEDLVAACALVYEAPPKLLLPDTIFRFKLKDDSKMKNEFLWSLFNERNFRKAVQSMATGSAGSMPNISKDKLNSLQIPLPPLPLQEKFAEIVQKFERVRRQQREATRQAEHLFQTLLHRAFRREL